jgi:polyphosphate:AMP phosphotransferase
MLENADLSLTVEKGAFKARIEPLRLRLAELQREAFRRGLPVVIVFEGWDASGKGTLINELMQSLDPRGFKVHGSPPSNEEERFRPFLWRFWLRTPRRGQFAIFDRGWCWRAVNDRVENPLGTGWGSALRDIAAFERQLADDGAVVVKCFLHISRKEQKRRFRRLLASKTTAWRVGKDDLKRRRRYGRYLAAFEDMLAETDAPCAPWTIVEAHDRRHACLKTFATAIEAIEKRLAALAVPAPPATRRAAKAPASPAVGGSILAKADLSLTLPRDEYERRLRADQETLRGLEHEIYRRRVPVVVVFEGWDAAGKGGNIRRLTQRLDPRGYEVVPVGAPDSHEKAYPYLRRFWESVPKAGHIAIFDRSWYGRVLVERVEGFCSEAEWRRAYREIVEMERHWTDFGVVLVKLWLQIDRAEQLRRFRDREADPYRRWKITDEDWRNRRRWNAYRAAVDEMVLRTGTREAPWTVVEANCKLHARIKTIESVIRAIRRSLRK